MGDVRKYIVSYGLESLLGGLANLNDMQLVTEEGEDVPFGEDEYYKQIIMEDENGEDLKSNAIRGKKTATSTSVQSFSR